MINVVRIHDILKANGLPVDTVSSVGGVPSVTYTRTLTAPEQSLANNLLADTYNTQSRKPRNLRIIFADLDALTPAQKLTIWNNIIAGTPPRWTLSNQVEVWLAIRQSETIADGVPLKTLLRIAAVAAYIRNENPSWLINPSFLPAINIPGDEIE